MGCISLILSNVEVVIFIGLQGAGKSSFYRARFASTHLHLSKDNWPNASRREARLQRELRAALGAGQSVVVDNTNVTQAARAPLIAIAHEFQARVAGYVFESHLQDCLERNRAREGRARVPDIAVIVTAQRLEMPAADEGFDELHFVRLRGGDFEVGLYDSAKRETNAPPEYPKRGL